MNKAVNFFFLSISILILILLNLNFTIIKIISCKTNMPFNLEIIFDMHMIICNIGKNKKKNLGREYKKF